MILIDLRSDLVSPKYDSSRFESEVRAGQEIALAGVHPATMSATGRPANVWGETKQEAETRAQDVVDVRAAISPLS